MTDYAIYPAAVLADPEVGELRISGMEKYRLDQILIDAQCQRNKIVVMLDEARQIFPDELHVFNMSYVVT